MNHLEAKLAADSIGLTPDESLAVRLVAWHETKYAKAWKGDGAGSNNMGAVTGKGDAGSFRHGDSRNDGGGVIQYTTDFARYSTPAAGLRGLARVMIDNELVRQAIRAQDIRAIAHAMYVDSYYTGINPRSKTAEGRRELALPGDAANVDAYTSALMNAYVAITAATGERWRGGARGVPLADPLLLARLSCLAALHGSLPVLRPGEVPTEVTAAIRAFQRVAGLKVDEVCGPKTWSMLLRGEL